MEISIYNECIKIIKSAFMDSNIEDSKKRFDNIYKKFCEDGNTFDKDNWKQTFCWYALGKPPINEFYESIRAVIDICPNLRCDEIYNYACFFYTVAVSHGNDVNYTSISSYAETFFTTQKMDRIIREMIPDKSSEEYNDLYIILSREFYKNIKDYKDKKVFNEFEFRSIINNYRKTFKE